MQSRDHLTLDALISDPLTQLVMRSDNQTPADMRRAFAAARRGLVKESILEQRRPSPERSMRDWLTQG